MVPHEIPQLITRKQNHMVPHVIPQLIMLQVPRKYPTGNMGKVLEIKDHINWFMPLGGKF
jgi:hypothetical protein